MIHTRRAGPLDARPMAELLNLIIAQGGSTAFTDPVDAVALTDWMKVDRAIWIVAEDGAGQLLGFQWVEPHSGHGAEVAQIGTYARVGKTGLGIGSTLFAATRDACKKAGYAWINAEIRADNSGGLAYYQSRGFEEYGRSRGHVLGNGQVVDKVLKRYDLD